MSAARLPVGVPAGRPAGQLHHVRVGHVGRPPQQQPLLHLLRGQHQRRAGRRARRTQEGLLQGTSHLHLPTITAKNDL